MAVMVVVVVAVEVEEGVCRTLFVLVPLHPLLDPLRVAEDHYKETGLSHCLYSGTFRLLEHRISSAGCRTYSSSVARCLVGPFRARGRRVVVGDHRASEPAFHARLHLVAAGLASSAARLLVCQRDL